MAGETINNIETIGAATPVGDEAYAGWQGGKTVKHTAASLKAVLRIATSDVLGLSAALSGKLNANRLGAANGAARLGADSFALTAELNGDLLSAVRLQRGFMTLAKDGTANADSLLVGAASLATPPVIPPGQYLSTLADTYDWRSVSPSPGVTITLNGVPFYPGYFAEPAQRLGYIIAKMAAGMTVNIAALGDSTVDGNETTGWSPNAGSNHASTAPNAWCAKLQALLREMYGNNNISVWNAGWSGQTSEWLHDNLDSKLIRNGSYGVPDICFVVGGLNDIATAGSQIVQHLAATRKTVRKLLGYGVLPILMTCDPFYRTASSGNVRDFMEGSRQINAEKFAVAEEYRIECWPIDRAISKWLELNNDSYQWRAIQADALHGGDDWHAFKAGWIAARLFHDAVWVEDDNVVRILNQDSRSAARTGQDDWFNGSNVRGGGNTRLQTSQSDYTSGQTVQTIWAFIARPTVSLVHRHIDESGANGARATGPRIKVVEKIRGASLFDAVIDSCGGTQGTDYRFSDRPGVVTETNYGLCKITMTAATTDPLPADLFLGYFELHPNAVAGFRRPRWVMPSPVVNALRYQGEIYYDSTGATDPTIIIADEAPDLSNVISYGRDDGRVSLLMNLRLDYGMGITLISGRGFSSGSTPRLRVALLLYRSSTEMKFHLLQADSATVTAFDPPLVAAAYADTGLQPIRVDFERVGGDGAQKVTLYTDWAGTTELMTYEGGGIPYAGFFGEPYVYTLATGWSGGGKIAHCQAAQIIYAPPP